MGVRFPLRPFKSKMDKEDFAGVYEIFAKGIPWLFNELKMCNIYLSAEFLASPDRTIYYGDIRPSLQKAGVLADLIMQKSVFEREEFFMTEAKFFCRYVESEDYKEAAKSRNDLVYFRHCFLSDSPLSRVPVRIKSLSRVLKEA